LWISYDSLCAFIPLSLRKDLDLPIGCNIVGMPTAPSTKFWVRSSGVPTNFVRGGGGVSTNSVEDRGQRERGSGGGSLLVSGSGGSCKLA